MVFFIEYVKPLTALFYIVIYVILGKILLTGIRQGEGLKENLITCTFKKKKRM